MKQIAIPEGLHVRLRAAAELRGMKLRTYTERALEAFIDAEPKPVKANGKAKGKSLWDAK